MAIPNIGCSITAMGSSEGEDPYCTNLTHYNPQAHTFDNTFQVCSQFAKGSTDVHQKEMAFKLVCKALHHHVSSWHLNTFQDQFSRIVTQFGKEEFFQHIHHQEFLLEGLFALNGRVYPEPYFKDETDFKSFWEVVRKVLYPSHPNSEKKLCIQYCLYLSEVDTQDQNVLSEYLKNLQIFSKTSNDYVENSRFKIAYIKCVASLYQSALDKPGYLNRMTTCMFTIDLSWSLELLSTYEEAQKSEEEVDQTLLLIFKDLFEDPVHKRYAYEILLLNGAIRAKNPETILDYFEKATRNIKMLNDDNGSLPEFIETLLTEAALNPHLLFKSRCKIILYLSESMLLNEMAMEYIAKTLLKVYLKPQLSQKELEAIIEILFKIFSIRPNSPWLRVNQELVSSIFNISFCMCNALECNFNWKEGDEKDVEIEDFYSLVFDRLLDNALKLLTLIGNEHRNLYMANLRIQVIKAVINEAKRINEFANRCSQMPASNSPRSTLAKKNKIALQLTDNTIKAIQKTLIALGIHIVGELPTTGNYISSILEYAGQFDFLKPHLELQKS